MNNFNQLFGGIILSIPFILVWGWWMNGYFRRRGVKSIPSFLPFIGDMLGLITQTEHLGEFLQRLYHAFPSEKYIGMMRFNVPTLLVTDKDVLKQVLIKDFDHFEDHHFNQSNDIVFGDSLLTLHGQKWRDMRATMSPAFIGSKMRMMVQLLSEVAERMNAALTEQYHKEAKGLLEVELKDVCLRSTTDMIANTAFGYNIDSFVDKENKFYTLAKDIPNFSASRFLLLIVIPKITKALGISSSLSSDASTYFRNIILNTMAERKERKPERRDMLDLVMEVTKGAVDNDVSDGNNNNNNNGKSSEHTETEEPAGKVKRKREWTDEEIIPQLNIFIAGGLEATSNTAAISAFYLAIYPHMQRRMQKEIDDVVAAGELTYDALHKMKYMDMVASETLRLWPGAIATDRKCTKEYTLPPPNDKSTKGYKLNVGDAVLIPMYAIQRDPQFFKNPNSFDPERFSDENKHKIVPGTYQPFGLGPRNCVAFRFGFMMSKIILFHLLWKFDLVLIPKSHPEIRLTPKTFGLNSVDGYWVGLKPRVTN